jgi:hypothetical protein
MPSSYSRVSPRLIVNLADRFRRSRPRLGRHPNLLQSLIGEAARAFLADRDEHRVLALLGERRGTGLEHFFVDARQAAHAVGLRTLCPPSRGAGASMARNIAPSSAVLLLDFIVIDFKPSGQSL